MTQGESRRSRQIMKGLRLEGWFCFKVHGSEMMMRGLPDVIVCAQGLFIGLETKTPDSRTKNTSTRRRQEYVHGLILDAGGKAFFVTTLAEALDAVNSVLAARALSSGAGGS